MPEVYLDVTELEPCEPLDQSLIAVRALVPGQFLRVQYQRRPNPLFPLLQQLGCSWELIKTYRSGGVELLIWHADDEQALAEIKQYMGY